MAAEREIIYIGDPMCSWCWGFAPVLQRVLADYREHASPRLLVGGLRPGDRAQRMAQQFLTARRDDWRNVQARTGRPFNYSFFDRRDFLYDTEPADRAVVAVRSLRPGIEFVFFNAIQQAFYIENIDVTLVENFYPLVESLDIDWREFANIFFTPDNRRETYAEFDQARDLGVGGFPSVLLRDGARQTTLTTGYQSYERLQPRLDNFFVYS